MKSAELANIITWNPRKAGKLVRGRGRATLSGDPVLNLGTKSPDQAAPDVGQMELTRFST